MKKIVVALLALVCAWGLVGCTKEENPDAARSVPTDFQSKANIQYGDMQLTALVTRTQEGETTVAFQSPESLSDLTLTFQGEDVRLSYKGLSMSLASDSFPARSIGKVMQDAINKALEPQGCTVSLENGVLEFQGHTDSYEFTLRLDAQNGNLLSLSVPGENLEISFENFQLVPQFSQENTQ